MTPNEILEYMTENRLEYDLINILMYNDYGISFIPLCNGYLHCNGGDQYSLFCGDEINIFGSDYQLPSFVVPEEYIKKNGWRHFTGHPEHIYSYLIRHGNVVEGEMFYDRTADGAKKLRNAAFLRFIDIAGISEPKDIRRAINRSRKMLEKNKKGRAYCTIHEYDLERMYDVKFWSSFAKSGSEYDEEELRQIHSIRAFRATDEIFSNRLISIDQRLYIEDGDSNYIQSVSFSTEFVPVQELHTRTDRPMAVVSPADTIPDILYRLAIETGANTMYIATGYAYDSGLTQLLPAIFTVREKKMHTIEVTVGDLHHYDEGQKQHAINRATAEKLNWLRDSTAFDKLYTHSSTFYHGKFYYISNGQISYMIMGSSNATESAYTKNKEFDILYRFDDSDREEEREILAWYASLKSECRELPRLREELFASNLYIDESGTSKSKSILRKLTSEEERDRYRFLEGLGPSSVEDDFFKSRKDFRAFANYMVFFYPERNITVIEGFSYGNSCYIFGTTDRDILKRELARKSKEQARRSDYYVTHIQHDDSYQDNILGFIHHQEKANGGNR